jgi:hypothetical protein
VIVPRAIVLVVCLVSGCSSTCSPGEVAGWYALTSGGTSYRINLKSDGEAALLIGGRSIGSFRWSLDQGDQQRLELQASGEVYTELRNLTAFAPSSVGAPEPAQGVLAMPAECNLGKTVRTLVINSERGLVFNRRTSSE